MKALRELFAPDALQEDAVATGMAVALGQNLEETELGGGDRNSSAGAPDLVALAVDL